MARQTQQQRRETTRRKLLEAGAEVFADHGFAGASIEQISDKAGMSRGAFYAHFEDKDELFLAVLDDMVDQLQMFSAQTVGGEGSAAVIDAIASVPVGHSRVDPRWFGLYSEFRTHALRDGPTRERLAHHYQRLRRVIADVIEAQFAVLGVGLPLAPMDLAALVVAVDEGLAIQRGVQPSAIRPDLFDDIVRTLIDAAVALDQQDPA